MTKEIYHISPVLQLLFSRNYSGLFKNPAEKTSSGKPPGGPTIFFYSKKG
jgi:hypothetical protein